MKKLLLLTIIGILFLGACASGPKIYKNGTYEGTGEGKKGPVVVSVEFKNDKIISVTIVSQTETEEIAADVLAQLPAKIVTAQSTEGLDTYAGATYTYNAILDAVNQTIEEAKIK